MRMSSQSTMFVSLLLSACASQPALTTSPSEPTHAEDGFKLERVVMLMRHGVRPPTKAKVTPDGMADQPWPNWQVGFGELTRHGYDAVRLVGAWDRTNWATRGLLPAKGCPAAYDIEVAASSKSRTQATACALVEGMAPGCLIDVDFPATPDADIEFHPLDAGLCRLMRTRPCAPCRRWPPKAACRPK